MNDHTCEQCGQPANERLAWFDTLTLHAAPGWAGQLSGRRYYCNDCATLAQGLFLLASRSGDGDACELPNPFVNSELLRHVDEDRTTITEVLHILVTGIVTPHVANAPGGD